MSTKAKCVRTHALTNRTQFQQKHSLLHCHIVKNIILYIVDYCIDRVCDFQYRQKKFTVIMVCMNVQSAGYYI